MNTRRRLLMSQAVQSTPVTIDNYVAGDIAFYDSTDDKIVLVHNEDINTDTYPASRYTPIGVVVIPNSHDVYGDGSCGVMSLMEMNCDTPDTGSTSYSGIYWGHYGTEISNLHNLNQAPYVGTGSNVGDANSTVIGQSYRVFLPSDQFDSVQCPHDTDAYYYSLNSSNYQAPSPYLTDGSRNPAYYQTTSPSSSNNSLADFDGKGNSEILWDLATAQSDWRTDSAITNNANANWLPAVCCCWRYHTNGTQKGDWYLPACGEFSYTIPPFNKINEAITKVLNGYGSSAGVVLDDSRSYWTSSVYNDFDIRITYTSSGAVYYTSRNVYSYTRAFIRIKPDGTITSRTTIS